MAAGPSVLDPDQLRRLVDAGRGLLAESRHLDDTVDRLLIAARGLTGARYAALGILDAERRRLSRFLTSGIPPERHADIGELPSGRGILGVLIEDPAPLRLHDLSADPRAHGLPAGHPPMRSFLGVPVLLGGAAWANLYLTEKRGGADFDDADEEMVVVLGQWAAVAIENARLHEALEERQGTLERAVRGLEATVAIAGTVGAETELQRVLELVVGRARSLAGARSVLVLLRDGDELTVAAAAGHVAPASGRPPSGIDALVAAGPLRIDDLDADGRLDSARLGVPDAAAALLVPLAYRGQALGVLCAFDRLDGPGPFDRDDEQVLGAIAASAATAVATAHSVEASRLRTAMQSAERERRRWARELHDETLQGLGGLKVLLAGAVRSGDDDRLRAAADEAVRRVGHEITGLRAVIAELRPAALDALGLGPALQGLAQRIAARDDLDVRVDLAPGLGRLGPDVETAVYRIAQEALTNVTKHARAATAVLRLDRARRGIELVIDDDGDGFDLAQPSHGYGLAGMGERAALAGGSLTVERRSPGTRISAWLPLTAPSPAAKGEPPQPSRGGPRMSGVRRRGTVAP